MNSDQINNNFKHHPSFGNQTFRYQLIRDTAKELAQLILRETPVSREQSLAFTNLEQAVFWANAAIARNEQETNDDA